jgi:hypothetical protein
MRSRAFTTALVLAVLALAATTVSADHIDRLEEGLPYGPLNQIPLALPEGDDVEIRLVLVISGATIYAARVTTVDAESQDRFAGLSELPYIGHLFSDYYDAGDFKPESRIGAAYVRGSTLMVDLGPVAGKSPNEAATGDDIGAEERAALWRRLGELGEGRGAKQARDIALAEPIPGARAPRVLAVVNGEFKYPLDADEFYRADTASGASPPIGPEALRALFDKPAGAAYLRKGEVVVLIPPTIFKH